MKSEERHRLQETELEKLGKHARDFWENVAKKHAKTILIGLGVACLLTASIAGYLIYNSSKQAERWKDVVIASFDRNPDTSLLNLQRAAMEHADYPAGQWAALVEAERALNEGIRAARTNRMGSLDELTRARDAFAKLSNSDSDLIQERRAFGMARCLEALLGVDLASGENDGQNVTVEEARLAYEKFVEDYGQEGESETPVGQSIYLSFAKERIEALKTDRVKKFYVWFRDEADLSPLEPAVPNDLGAALGANLPTGHPSISSDTGPSFPKGPGSPSGPSGPSAPSFPTPEELEKTTLNELETFVNEAKAKSKADSKGPEPKQSPPDPSNGEKKKPAEPPKAEEKKPAASPKAKSDSNPKN